MIEIHGEVTFFIKEEVVEQIKAKAFEIDESGDWGAVNIPEEYEIRQALQVVWHQDPEWLHRQLSGWTLDKAATVPDGTMREIWP